MYLGCCSTSIRVPIATTAGVHTTNKNLLISNSSVWKHVIFVLLVPSMVVDMFWSSSTAVVCSIIIPTPQP